MFHGRLPYRITLILGIFVTMFAACGRDASQSEVDALRQEVTALREAQAQMQKAIEGLQEAAKRQPVAAVSQDTPGREAVHRIPTNFSPRKGNQIAAVTVVEFADFQCPFCQAASGLPDQLVREFPNDVQFVFKHYPLGRHAQAFGAAKAAWAAHQQGKFWEMHDLIYGGDIQNLSQDVLRGYAEKIGLDMARYDADLASPKASQTVSIDKALGKRMKVGGTPTYFVNGKRVTETGPGAVRNKVRAELAAAKAAAGQAGATGPAAGENAAPTDASANGS